MTTSIIDKTTFEELKAAMGDDFIPELISTFLEEIPSILKALQQAYQEGDAATFQRSAHSIKSSSASMGALTFSAQARELEMIGKSGDISQAGEKMNGLISAYPELEQALRNLL